MSSANKRRPNRGGAALAIAMAAAALVQAHTASAQAIPGTPPPGWPELIRCAGLGDYEQELSCYREAMRRAGFSPDPAAVASDRRRKFGLTLPRLGSRDARPKEDRAAAPAAAGRLPDIEDEVVVTLARVSFMPPANRFLVVTSEGAVWEQIDNEPMDGLKPGQSITIRRTRMGGYFCRIDKHRSARCSRAN